jgi:dihydroflavonol-4-reductase
MKIRSETLTVDETTLRSFNVQKTAFVTGASGFLGLNLIQSLLQQNWQVIGLHLPNDNLTYLSRLEGVTMVAGELKDVDVLVRSIPGGADALFHVAANTSAWARNNARQYLDNVEGTRNVVQAALQKKVRRFIYTSSISAYGYHPGEIVNEMTVSNALTCGMQYNRTKFLAENIVKEAVHDGLNAVILNPCNIIGPYDTKNWTRQFIRPVYRGNLATVPPGKAMWCHVRDIVDAHISAVEQGGAGENYLLGGTEARFLEVVNEIERQLGKPESRRVQPAWLLRMIVPLLSFQSKMDGQEPILTPEKYNRAVAYIACDYRKAAASLGYHTSPLSDMIRDALNWLKKEDLL